MSIIVLNTLVDIYSNADKSGKQKIIKKNVQCRRTFDTNSILVEEYIKPTGIISKKQCNVKEGDNYYRVNHSFEYVSKLINPPQLYIVGYKRWINAGKEKTKTILHKRKN